MAGFIIVSNAPAAQPPNNPIMTATAARKWTFDLNIQSTEIPAPIGYSLTNNNGANDRQLVENASATTSAVTAGAGNDKLTILKRKRAQTMAMAPGQQLLLTAFMMWMSGGGVHIFSIMIVGMGLITPIKGIMGTNAYFAPLLVGGGNENLDLTQPKLIYVGFQLLGLGIALYKCYTMGLLPLSSADWISLLETKRNLEFSSGGPVLAEL